MRQAISYTQRQKTKQSASCQYIGTKILLEFRLITHLFVMVPAPQPYMTQLGLARLGATYIKGLHTCLDLNSYYSVHTGIQAFSIILVP